MTIANIEKYRMALLEMRARFLNDVVQLSDEAFRKTGSESTGNLSDMPIHLADIASDHFDQELTMSLLENEGEQLREINDALQRINDGTYGICERCHQQIAPARLQALPATRYCVKCSEVVSQERG